jgi:uncharacterized protein YpuA (DUF1002 family)
MATLHKSDFVKQNAANHKLTRSDTEAINDSMEFSIQGLHVRGNEVQALRTQVLILQQLFIDFRRRNRGLQQENKELKKIVDSYANDWERDI